MVGVSFEGVVPEKPTIHKQQFMNNDQLWGGGVENDHEVINQNNL